MPVASYYRSTLALQVANYDKYLEMASGLNRDDMKYLSTEVRIL